MNKTWLIIRREYLSRVRKRSFLITTILVPIVIIGFYAAIIAISISDSSEKNRIAVIDNAQLFNGNMEKAEGDKSDYFFINGETEASFASKYKAEGYDYFLYIPSMAANKDADSAIRLHSATTVGIGTNSKIEKTINSAIEKKRMVNANINPDQYKAISSDISLEHRLDRNNKNEKGSGGTAVYIISFGCGILIYMILIIYGTMVMRGVMEEKISRIAEVLVSSVKPFQLMLGKIIGIGAVGLTQFGIWIVFLTLLQFILPVVMPSMAHHMAEQAATNPAAHGGGQLAEISEGLRSAPVGMIAFFFLFYFLGGYLMYASFFAAIGSVISEDQQEAQQLVFPVMMPIILGFVIMTKAVSQPNSGLAVFGSLFPLTSPVVMMGRLMYGVPTVQLIISMLLLLASFFLFTWLTAKIYRTGILLYGKKPTWKEMIKWAFRKS